MSSSPPVPLFRLLLLLPLVSCSLQAVYPINLNDQTNLFSPKIAGCNISLFYYAGFAYLMMRR
jgi:translation initiation factor 3 subunit L